jgi:hypothetical protein
MVSAACVDPPRCQFPRESFQMAHALKKKPVAGAATLCAATAGVAPAQTPNEKFFPLLVLRTGPYAPNGVPWATVSSTT